MWKYPAVNPCSPDLSHYTAAHPVSDGAQRTRRMFFVVRTKYLAPTVQAPGPAAPYPRSRESQSAVPQRLRQFSSTPTGGGEHYAHAPSTAVPGFPPESQDFHMRALSLGVFVNPQNVSDSSQPPIHRRLSALKPPLRSVHCSIRCKPPGALLQFCSLVLFSCTTAPFHPQLGRCAKKKKKKHRMFCVRTPRPKPIEHLPAHGTHAMQAPAPHARLCRL